MPVVEEVGGVGPAYRLLSFPPLAAGQTSTWLIKDGLTVGTEATSVTTKLNFQSNNDEAGLVIAFQDTGTHIVVTANPYWDDLTLIESVNGVWRQAVSKGRGKIQVAVGQNYWLRVATFDAGANGGKTLVASWSLDGVNFVEQKRLNNLVNIIGRVGYTTWSYSPPHVHFDDFTVATAVDLSITTTDSPDPVQLGNNLTYAATVTNNGSLAATGVIVTDTLPGNTSLVSATSTQGTCTVTRRTVSCNLGLLDNGTGATLTIVVTPKKSGIISNTATVKANESDPDTGNNTVTVSTVVVR